MRKNRDFVFLRPVKWLGIGMMAALAVACEKPVVDASCNRGTVLLLHRLVI